MALGCIEGGGEENGKEMFAEVKSQQGTHGGERDAGTGREENLTVSKGIRTRECDGAGA